MRRAFSAFTVACAAIIVGNMAQAEATLPSQAPVPEQAPFYIPIGTSIGLAKAKELVAAAGAEAAKHNWNIAIAVVDPSGNLVAYEKIDDTQLASAIVAQKKAVTAALYRRPTAVFYDAMETGHASVATLNPSPVASPGGFPLVENGKLIGAIGCSGVHPLQDAAACKVAVEKLQ